MRRIGLIRVLACWLAIAPGLLAQQFIFQPYKQAEGLENLSVTDVAVDQKGFLWVGTENGLYRLTGTTFEHIGPIHGIVESFISAVVVDPNGTVWAATGQNLYHSTDLGFVPAGKSPISVTRWNRLAVEDQSHLLLVDSRRLYRLEHDAHGNVLSYRPAFTDAQIAANPVLDHISSVSVINDAQGGCQVWVGSGGDLYSWPETQADIARIPSAQTAKAPPPLTQWGSNKGLEEDTWQTVMRDHSGALWAGGTKHVEVLPPGAARFVDHDIPDSNAGNTYDYAPLKEDREGRIVVPSEDGVARWESGRWKVYDRTNGLQIGAHVTALAFDSTGDLWVGTHGNGLLDWTGYNDWEGWSDALSLPSPVIWSVAPTPSGRVYVGTDKGPAWIDPANGSSGPLYASRKWAFGQVNTLGMHPDGSLWSGTYAGSILRIDPKSRAVNQQAKLPASIIRSLADSAGNLFFATDQGIFQGNLADPHGTFRNVAAAQSLLTDSVKVDAACQAPDASLWFLSLRRLIHLKDGQWTRPDIDNLPKLPGRTLDLSCAPDGSLWMTGQQTGTWRLTPAADRLAATQLQLPRELHSVVPVAIVVDTRGWVWLGTDSGLLVWNGQNWRHLTQESGLIWNDVNRGALQFAPDGSLWIGTSGGLSHLLHPDQVFAPVPLNVQITHLEREATHYSPLHPLTLPWSTQPLVFQIAFPAFPNSSETVYSHRMVGLQNDWASKKGGMVTHDNLQPGNYTFQARVQNSALNASSNIVSVQINILPPWWRSKWFYALCVLTLILLLWAADRLRVRHLRQRSRQLENLVRKRTIELEESREQLRLLAAMDGLTGMLNRIAIMKALTAEMERARREATILVIAMVDLDHFKRINDEYGHLAGDEAIRAFASAVNAAMRPYDHAGRFGGEEFLLVLANIPRDAVDHRLARLHKAISNLEAHLGETCFPFTCSIGAVVFNPSEGVRRPEALLAIADSALYNAKDTVRNRVVLGSKPSLDSEQVLFTPIELHVPALRI